MFSKANHANPKLDPLLCYHFDSYILQTTYKFYYHLQPTLTYSNIIYSPIVHLIVKFQVIYFIFLQINIFSFFKPALFRLKQILCFYRLNATCALQVYRTELTLHQFFLMLNWTYYHYFFKQV